MFSGTVGAPAVPRCPMMRTLAGGLRNWLDDLSKRRPRDLVLSQTRPQPIVWTPELVARFWDGFSETSLEALSFSRTAGSLLADIVAHHLPPGTRCLDFGAGSGDLCAELLRRGLPTAAYEPSQGRRQSIHERFRDEPRFLGLVESPTRERFDVVFAVEVLEHVLDSEWHQTLHRLTEFLEMDGLVVITTPNNENLELGACYCPVSNVIFHRWQHVRSFTAATLSAAMRQAGIAPVVVHELEFSQLLLAPLKAQMSPDEEASLPDYLLHLRQDVPAKMGSEASLLYLGRKGGR